MTTDNNKTDASDLSAASGSLITWTLPNGSTITFTPSRGKSLIRGMGLQAIGPYLDVKEEELGEYLSENK